MFYLEHLAQPGFHQPYGRFRPAFCNVPAIAAGLLPQGNWATGGAGFDPAHLRFLYVLLVFSPALLPLFCYLRGPRGTRLAGRAAEQAVRHPLAILAVAAVPVIVTEAVFGPDGITGGWERLAYLFPPVPSFIVSLRSTTWPTTSPAPVTTGVLTATPARREPQPTTQPPRSFTGACTISPRPGPASTPRSPSSTLMSASSSSWAVPNGTRSDAVESRVGLGGLVTVARVDQGALLSLSGEPLEAMLYLVGNPLVAREITSHNPGGALYAPFRAAVFRDLTGVHVAYDQPSTVFASLGSAAIDAIANELDLKIAAAARYACTMQP